MHDCKHCNTGITACIMYKCVNLMLLSTSKLYICMQQWSLAYLIITQLFNGEKMITVIVWLSALIKHNPLAHSSYPHYIVIVDWLVDANLLTQWTCASLYICYTVWPLLLCHCAICTLCTVLVLVGWRPQLIYLYWDDWTLIASHFLD